MAAKARVNSCSACMCFLPRVGPERNCKQGAVLPGEPEVASGPGDRTEGRGKGMMNAVYALLAFVLAANAVVAMVAIAGIPER